MVVLMIMIGLGLMFLGGILFLFIGIILAVTNKKREEEKKKKYKTASKAFIIAGIIAWILPLAWLTVVRISNGEEDSDYIKTGTMVTWKDDSFIYKGEEYTEVEINDPVFASEVNDFYKKKNAAFNIKEPRSFSDILFNAEDKQVMFKVKNNFGIPMYTDGDLYCPKKDIKKVVKYYKNMENYKWTFSVNEGKEKDIVLTKEEKQFLDGLKVSDAKKSLKLETKDYTFGSIYRHSKDGVLSGRSELVLYKEDWYWDSGEYPDVALEGEDEDVEYVYGYKLPTNLQEKINNLVQKKSLEKNK